MYIWFVLVVVRSEWKGHRRGNHKALCDKKCWISFGLWVNESLEGSSEGSVGKEHRGCHLKTLLINAEIFWSPFPFLSWLAGKKQWMLPFCASRFILIGSILPMWNWVQLMMTVFYSQLKAHKWLSKTAI